MEKIVIKSIARYDKKKDGTPYDGLRVVVFDGERYLSVMDKYGSTRDWKEGIEIEVETEKKGDFWNIMLPKRQFNNEVQKQILAKLTSLELGQKKILDLLAGKTPEKEQAEPINEDDLPF